MKFQTTLSSFFKTALVAVIFCLAANASQAQKSYAHIDNQVGHDLTVDIYTVDCSLGTPVMAFAKSVAVSANTVQSFASGNLDNVVLVVVHTPSGDITLNNTGCSCLPGPTSDSGSASSYQASSQCTAPGSKDLDVLIWW